jgi:hypothetical protein
MSGSNDFEDGAKIRINSLYINCRYKPNGFALNLQVTMDFKGRALGVLSLLYNILCTCGRG